MKINLKEAFEVFQKMQEEFQKLKKESSEKIFEGQSGAGLVTAKVNGNIELVALEISNQAFELNDKSLLEDLIIAAINSAIEKAKENSATELQKFLGPLASSSGFNINF